MGGAEQVQVVLAFRGTGTVARGEILHGGAALGNDRFEGSGPQHCFLHVLIEYKTAKSEESEESKSDNLMNLNLSNRANNIRHDPDICTFETIPSKV